MRKTTEKAEKATKPAAPAPAAPPAVEAPTPAATETLSAMMALSEPARTEALEKAVNSAMTVNLRSRTGQEVRVRYGGHILAVPEQAKPFTAGHAIHLLFTAPDLVEEVAEE